MLNSLRNFELFKCSFKNVRNAHETRKKKSVYFDLKRYIRMAKWMIFSSFFFKSNWILAIFWANCSFFSGFFALIFLETFHFRLAWNVSQLDLSLISSTYCPYNSIIITVPKHIRARSLSKLFILPQLSPI